MSAWYVKTEGKAAGDIPRSLTRISLPAITSLCWLISAFLSFKIFFFSGSKMPNRLGSLPPACLARISLTSCTVVLSVILTLVGSFLMGVFGAVVLCLARYSSGTDYTYSAG